MAIARFSIKDCRFKLDTILSNGHIAKYEIVAFGVSDDGISAKYRVIGKKEWVSSGLFPWSEIVKMVRIPS